MNLCSLVNQLTLDLSAGKEKKIINDISPSLEALTSRSVLEEILAGLLGVCWRSVTPEIRIAARTFHHLILLQIKYKDTRPESGIETELEPIKILAESLGGCVYISSNNLHQVTTSFTFLSHTSPVAALS